MQRFQLRGILHDFKMEASAAVLAGSAFKWFQDEGQRNGFKWMAVEWLQVGGGFSLVIN